MTIQQVIDVDTTTAWSPPDTRSWRSRHPVPTIVLLALAVVVVLTGPGLLQSTSFTLAWQIKASTRFFWLTPEAVYSLDDVGHGVVELSAHEVENQRIMWSLPIHGRLASLYTGSDPLFDSNLPPGETGVHTTITSGDSQDTYPASAIPLVYLADDLIITIDRDPENEPAEAGSDPTGLGYAHLVTVRDLATRAVLWTRRLEPGVRWSLPGVRASTAGIVGLPAGAEWMATSRGDGQLEVWNLRDGSTRARRMVGQIDGSAYVTALTTLVVVGQSADDGLPRLAAFDPVTLAPVWRLIPPLANAEPVSCEPELCLVSHRATWIMSPRTNLVTARVNGTEVRPGPPGEALVVPYGQEVSVVTTDSGLNRPIPGENWRIVDATAYDPQAVVVQLHALGRADVGLLDVARATVIPVGATNQWSPYYDCLAISTTIACDDGTHLSVWRRPG